MGRWPAARVLTSSPASGTPLSARTALKVVKRAAVRAKRERGPVGEHSAC